MCHLIGKRAQCVTPQEAAAAWFKLAERLEEMSELDIPKFRDLIISIRVSHIYAKSAVRKVRLPR